ncbi:MAG: hypothetical protein B7Z51_10915 [Methyloversatilis sp. 12-65-5]|nr:MAG: hypothetical protein B7Z51_10915 [Methyloversatilis sp. 12-65-5]
MIVRFLLALLCALPLTAHAERSVQSSPEQLKALQQRMEALRDELNQSESAHREARDELRSSEKAISDATRALRDISRQRKEVETALARTRADIATGDSPPPIPGSSPGTTPPRSRMKQDVHALMMVA